MKTKIKTVEINVLDICLSPREINLIFVCCEILGKDWVDILGIKYVDELIKWIFSIHGCLDSKSGGDTLCKLLEKLKDESDSEMMCQVRY